MTMRTKLWALSLMCVLGMTALTGFRTVARVSQQVVLNRGLLNQGDASNFLIPKPADAYMVENYLPHHEDHSSSETNSPSEDVQPEADPGKSYSSSADADAVMEDGLCAAVGQKSPMALWMHNLDQILQASRAPQDRHFRELNKTSHVLQLLTPRLELAQKALPRDWKHLESFMMKLDKRMRYLQAKKRGEVLPKEQEAPKPLQVLVLGGSVAMGVNCWTGIRKYNNGPCAWSARLNTLVNNLMGFALGDSDASKDNQLIEIQNTAVGGTNTATGKVILDYNLLPKQSYDVIINAYSTNDMHVMSMEQAAAAGLSIREATFNMAQEFARVALTKCTEEGETPLLLWLDDYIGNEQRQILTTTELSQGVQVLANYYGFGFVSYAETVRDLVYGTTNETSFSPKDWYKNGPLAAMTREVHPGVPMHTATAFVMAYYFLQLTHRTCQFENWKVSSWDGNPAAASVPGLPALRGTILPNPPDRRPLGLPPPLNMNLTLDEVSAKWRGAEPVSCAAPDKQGLRCPIAWVAGVMVDDSPGTTLKYFEPYLQKEPMEWVWKDERNKKNNPKYGFLPNVTAANSSAMMLDIPVSGQEIRTVTAFFMRSYGKQWEGSAARVDLFVDGNMKRPAQQATLAGSHEKKTSEMYTEEIQLATPAKSRLKIGIHHVGGATFKLQGIAVCS